MGALTRRPLCGDWAHRQDPGASGQGPGDRPIVTETVSCPAPFSQEPDRETAGHKTPETSEDAKASLRPENKEAGLGPVPSEPRRKGAGVPSTCCSLTPQLVHSHPQAPGRAGSSRHGPHHRPASRPGPLDAERLALDEDSSSEGGRGTGDRWAGGWMERCVCR